jgi:hypothetical protein
MHPQDELWQAVLEDDVFDANAILREEPEANVNFRYIESMLAVRVSPGPPSESLPPSLRSPPGLHRAQG